jgi:predicted phosphodiesterase
VVADLHANLPALQAVLADMQKFDVDGIIAAGDLIVGGPLPNETMALLRAAHPRTWMIRGNGEDALVRFADSQGPAAWRSAQQYAVLRWSAARIGQEALDYVRSLPEQRTIQVDGADPLRVVHGSPRRIAERIVPEEDMAVLDIALSQVAEPVMICAHTHRAWQQMRLGKLALNPGAVSAPLDGVVGARYALLSWDGRRWSCEHRCVGYDIEGLRAIYQESGMLSEAGPLAEFFLLSIETGLDIAEQYVSYARAATEQAGLRLTDHIPDQVWEQAAASFPRTEWSARSAEMCA